MILVGRVLTRVEQRRPDLRFPFPDRFVARLVGQLVERLERRATYLRAHLSGCDVLYLHYHADLFLGTRYVRLGGGA